MKRVVGFTVHSFTLFTGTAVQLYNTVACTIALLFGIYGNIDTCHVNHVIHICN